MQTEHPRKLNSFRVVKPEFEKIYVTSLKVSVPLWSPETTGFLNMKLLHITYDKFFCMFYKSIFISQVCLYSQSTDVNYELVNLVHDAEAWRNYFKN